MRETYSGVVCEKETYPIPDRLASLDKANPKERFKDDAEREKHREQISRRNNTRVVNENCTPYTLYSTLTMANDYEVHTFEEAKQILRNYIRRLVGKSPDAQVVRAVMGRGKKTGRIHFHMLTNGISSERISAKWVEGRVVRIENLRAHNYYNGIDHGQDYTGLANYLFDHWTPEQGGHRWKYTRNLRKPDMHPPVIHEKRNTLKKPPAAPRGYKLVEAREGEFGYQYFKYVRKVGGKDVKKPAKKKTTVKRRE